MTKYAIVPGWPDYRVGTDGTVWTSKLRANGGWRELRQAHPRGGYPHVSLSQDNVRRDFTVHSLVLLTFVGPKPPGQLCRHLNGDPTDNRLENLRWGTPRENEADKRAHGRIRQGEGVGNSKLTDETVARYREIYASGGVGCDELAARSRVNRTTILKALHGRTFSHLPVPDYSARPRAGKVRKGAPRLAAGTTRAAATWWPR